MLCRYYPIRLARTVSFDYQTTSGTPICTLLKNNVALSNGFIPVSKVQRMAVDKQPSLFLKNTEDS